MQKLAELLYPGILLLFSLLFFAGLKHTVVIDYEEGLYAEVSRSMYVDHEPVIPTMNGSGFYEKQPMLYWAQMLGYELFGVSAFGARFFNVLSGLATLLVLYFGGKGALGSRTAFYAALVLGSSMLFVYLSRVATGDMIFTLFLTSALVLFYHSVERALQERGGTVLFWTGCCCAGLAALSAGVIGALVPLATAVIYLVSIGRPTIIFRTRWFFPGTALVILIGFSWYLLLGMRHPHCFDGMRQLFLQHAAAPFSSALEKQPETVVYYLVILLIGFMPWFSYLPLAVVHTPIRSGRHPGAGFLRLFIICSAIVVLFSPASPATKMVSALLPALPGLALMISCLFSRDEIKRPVFWRAPGYLSALLAFLLGISVAAVPFVFPYLADLLGRNARKAPALGESVNFGYSLWLAALLFLGCSLLIVRAARKNDISRIFEALLISSIVSSASLFLVVFPHYDRIFDAPLARLAVRAAAEAPDGGPIMLYQVDDRPSVNFVSGRLTVSLSERDYQGLIDRFKQSGSSVGLTTVYYFEQLKNRNIPVTEISRDTGFLLFRPDPGFQDPLEMTAPSPAADALLDQ